LCILSGPKGLQRVRNLSASLCIIAVQARQVRRDLFSGAAFCFCKGCHGFPAFRVRLKQTPMASSSSGIIRSRFYSVKKITGSP
jgi:hypothetical protein